MGPQAMTEMSLLFHLPAQTIDTFGIIELGSSYFIFFINSFA
jgi:hypothetical protein